MMPWSILLSWRQGCKKCPWGHKLSSTGFVCLIRPWHIILGFHLKKCFKCFGSLFCPSTQYILYWSKAQRIGQEAIPTPSPSRKIPVIDEFFIYCCRVATGLKEQVIADIFQVSTAEMVPTPSWIFPLGCGTSKGETSNKNVTVFFYIVVITDVF